MKPVKTIVKETDIFFDINIIDYALMSNVAKVKLKIESKFKSHSMNFFEIYCKIKDDYDSGRFITVDPVTKNRKIDQLFKQLYQNFYKLRAPRSFINECFEILEDSKIWGSGWAWRTKYHEIAKRLEPYSEGKFQLSFISKLLHTVDNTFPIYDKNVRGILDISNNTGSSYSDKATNGEKILEQLKKQYAALKKNEDFGKLVKQVNCFSGSTISFEKKCDFIFWVMGDIALKTKKAGKKSGKTSGKTSVKGSAAGKGAGTKSGAAANTSGNSTGEANSEENTNIEKETFDMEMEEYYARKVSGTYPYNLLESIFGREAENTEDAQKGAELEKTLSEIIELRLTDEEKTVLFKVYRDGKSLAEIAEEQGADPYETYIHMAASLRKLRHPSSSKLLKGFLQEEQ